MRIAFQSALPAMVKMLKRSSGMCSAPGDAPLAEGCDDASRHPDEARELGPGRAAGVSRSRVLAVMSTSFPPGPAPHRRGPRMTQWCHAQEGRRHRWRHRRSGGRVGAPRARRRRDRHRLRGQRPGRRQAAPRAGRRCPRRRRGRVRPRTSARGPHPLRGDRRRPAHHAPRVGGRDDRLGRPPLADAVRHRHGGALDPESVRGLLTDDEVRRLAHEPLAPLELDDVSVGDFVDARLGPAVTDKLVEPLLAGVYAGHARRISLDMAVPALSRAAHEGRSLLDVAREAQLAALSAPAAVLPVFATLVGGLGTLPPALEAALLDGRGRGAHRRCRARPAPRRRRLGRVDRTDDRRRAGASRRRRHRRARPTGLAPARRHRSRGGPSGWRRSTTPRWRSSPLPSTVALRRSRARAASSCRRVEGLTIKAATFSTSKWPWLAEAHPTRTWLRASDRPPRRGGLPPARRRRARRDRARRPPVGRR